MKCFFSFFLVLLCWSCVEDVDFDQAENIQLNPVVEANVFYFTVESNRFVDQSGTPVTTVQDYSDVELFNDEFVKDNLQKAELLFEFTNSIQKNMVVRVEMVDSSNTILHTTLINVLSGTTANPVVTNHTELFEAANLDQLKETVKVNVVITLSDASGVAQNGAVLKLHSKGVFYMNVAVNS